MSVMGVMRKDGEDLILGNVRAGRFFSVSCFLAEQRLKVFSTSTSFWEHRAQIMFQAVNGLSLLHIIWELIWEYLVTGDDLMAGIIRRLFYSHMWCPCQANLRAGMANGSAASLEFGFLTAWWPQHGWTYSVAVQGSKCVFVKETRQKLNFLL